jgi:hypothetical protein
MTDVVTDALTSAGIPESKVGPARGAQLAPAERELYVWMLQGFANGSPPSAGAIRTEAARLGLDLNRTRQKLATEDLIHFGGDGEIAVAYPFSAHPTRHRVHIEGHTLYAMCAIDALGVAPMCDRAVVIDSSDPLTNDDIKVWLQPDGKGTWHPHEAVVVAGRSCDGAAFEGCCRVLNFFASSESAERYVRERAVDGFAVTISQAIDVGRAIFGDVLKEV